MWLRSIAHRISLPVLVQHATVDTSCSVPSMKVGRSVRFAGWLLWYRSWLSRSDRCHRCWVQHATVDAFCLLSSVTICREARRLVDAEQWRVC